MPPFRRSGTPDFHTILEKKLAFFWYLWYNVSCEIIILKRGA